MVRSGLSRTNSANTKIPNKIGATQAPLAGRQDITQDDEGQRHEPATAGALYGSGAHQLVHGLGQSAQHDPPMNNKIEA